MEKELEIRVEKKEKEEAGFLKSVKKEPLKNQRLFYLHINKTKQKQTLSLVATIRFWG